MPRSREQVRLQELPALLRLRFPGQEGYELQVVTLAGEPLFRSVGIGATGLAHAVDLPTDSARPVRIRV